MVGHGGHRAEDAEARWWNTAAGAGGCMHHTHSLGAPAFIPFTLWARSLTRSLSPPPLRSCKPAILAPPPPTHTHIPQLDDSVCAGAGGPLQDI
jgi:hypothetical protein